MLFPGFNFGHCKNEYLFGRFHMRMKLVPVDSDRMIATFYARRHAHFSSTTAFIQATTILFYC